MEAALAACRATGAAVLPRGAGTSLAGQCANVAVVFDFSRYMNGLTSIDPAAKLATVEPGIVLDRLREAAERHHLTYAPDPATHSRCTLGGMIGNNSCGVHGLLGGKVVDNVESLDLIFYDGTRMTVGRTSPAELEALIRAGGRVGQIYADLARLRDRYGADPRKISAHSPPRLRLQPRRAARRERLPRGPRAGRFGGHLRHRRLRHAESRRQPALPRADGAELRRCIPPPMQCRACWNSAPSASKALTGCCSTSCAARVWLSTMLRCSHRAADFCWSRWAHGMRPRRRPRPKPCHAAQSWPEAPTARIYSAADAARVWHVRESALGATVFVPGEPEGWEGWEDAGVPPARLGAYLRRLAALMGEYGYRSPLYGHYGQGCVHMRINFDFRTEEGLRKFREFIERAADLVLGFGGSLSGEHGDGQSRAALLPKMFGPELMQAFREFKAIWDPENRMNPGKLVDAVRVYDPVENLHHAPPAPGETHAKAGDALCLCRRWGIAGARHRALRGRGRMPQDRGWRDVPQLSRHRRGAALHARPRPPAVGDAGRRAAQGRLPEPGRP